MAIVINGSGTVTGLAVGGLPDGTVDAGTVAADVATQAEIDAKLNLAGGALTGDVTLTTGSSPTIKVEETGGSYIEMEAGGSTGHIKSKSGHDITFSPGGTNHLQLYSSGRAKSQFTAKAWARIDMEANTMAITDAHNISSVTDRGEGLGRITFANNMGNANYTVVGNCLDGGGENDIRGFNHSNETTWSTSIFDWYTTGHTGGANDAINATMIIFGD
jgi:hypothetical protein